MCQTQTVLFRDFSEIYFALPYQCYRHSVCQNFSLSAPARRTSPRGLEQHTQNQPAAERQADHQPPHLGDRPREQHPLPALAAVLRPLVHHVSRPLLTEREHGIDHPLLIVNVQFGVNRQR